MGGTGTLETELTTWDKIELDIINIGANTFQAGGIATSIVTGEPKLLPLTLAGLGIDCFSLLHTKRMNYYHEDFGPYTKLKYKLLDKLGVTNLVKKMDDFYLNSIDKLVGFVSKNSKK